MGCVCRGARDVEEGHGNGKGTYEFANDTDEVCVGLSLLQLPVRVIPVRDNALAVGPSPQGWRLVGGVELHFDGRLCQDGFDY